MSFFTDENGVQYNSIREPEFDDKFWTSDSFNSSDIKFLCVKCNKGQSAQVCRNCNGSKFYMKLEVPLTGASTKKWICENCKQSIERWTCSKCNCDNPISKTIHVKKSADPSPCFIATACYGNYDSPEVMVLRQFRDEILLTNPIGTIFTRLYYAVSPPVADFIASHEFLKKIVRQILIAPSVGWAAKRLKPMKKKS